MLTISIMLTPEAIRAIREGLGQNFTQFAAMLGVSENTVRRWEMGDRHPRYDMMLELNRIAREKKINIPKECLA